MKRFFAILLLCVTFTTASAQWKPAGDNLKTEWGENLDPNNVLTEYPRPIMERQKWKNLNGLWNYAITKKDADLVGQMASEGTTPRRLTDLIGSLCDLTSGSGDKGTPIVYIQGYFDNYTTD